MSLRKKISRRLKYSRGTSPQGVKNHYFRADATPRLPLQRPSFQ